jgi:hypothetical protein
MAPPPPPGNSFNGTPIPPVPPAPAEGAVPAAPSAFGNNGSGEAPGPSVATAQYDPRTGDYMSPDGMLQQQTNLAVGGIPKSWKDLMPS